MRTRILIPFMMALAVPANAEIYMGIGPECSLGDVRVKFPHAKFNKMTPAWAKEEECVYQVTGEGISGVIFVLFRDSRVIIRNSIIKAKQASNNQIDPKRLAIFEEMIKGTEDSAT